MGPGEDYDNYDNVNNFINQRLGKATEGTTTTICNNNININNNKKIAGVIKSTRAEHFFCSFQIILNAKTHRR